MVSSQTWEYNVFLKSGQEYQAAHTSITAANFECNAGQAQVHLQRPRQQPTPPQHQQRRHPERYRLRHQARRGHARATAAKAATPTAKMAVQDDNAVPDPRDQDGPAQQAAAA